MMFSQHGVLGSFDDTYEIFLIIGDSIADGRGATVPVVPASTLYIWNGSSIDEVTTQSVSNDATSGSIWQNFAIEYKKAFRRRVVIVQHGFGGSEFYPNGDTNNWYTSGTLYSPAISAANACKSFIQSKQGTVRVNVIVCCGVNDIRGAQTTNNIGTAIDSLKTRLNSDLSTPQQYWIIPGRTDTVFNNDKCQIVRRYIVNVCLDANCHAVSMLQPFENWGMYQVDDLHITQTGNDLVGTQIVRYLNNSNYHKDARTIFSSFKDDVSVEKKIAIHNFISFFSAFTGTMDAFCLFVGSSRENIMIDWGMVSAPRDLGSTLSGTFIANDCLSMDGASQYLDTSCLQISTSRTTNTDYIEFVKTGTVGEASGTSAFLFGRSNSLRSARIYQGTSALHIQSFDATDNSNATEAKFADDAIYAHGRNGTTKIMKKNSTDVISVVQATTGTITTQAAYVGTSNTDGTPAAQCIQSEFKCYGMLQLSEVVWSDFVTALNTLITAMETP
jgi:hypothetical protein